MQIESKLSNYFCAYRSTVLISLRYWEISNLAMMEIGGKARCKLTRKVSSVAASNQSGWILFVAIYQPTSMPADESVLRVFQSFANDFLSFAH